MKRGHLKRDSKRFLDQLYESKERWHTDRSKESFSEKIRKLDKLREMSQSLSKGTVMIPSHNRVQAQIEISHVGPESAVVDLNVLDVKHAESEFSTSLEKGEGSWTSTSHSFAIMPNQEEKYTLWA